MGSDLTCCRFLMSFRQKRFVCATLNIWQKSAGYLSRKPWIPIRWYIPCTCGRDPPLFMQNVSIGHVFKLQTIKKYALPWSFHSSNWKGSGGLHSTSLSPSRSVLHFDAMDLQFLFSFSDPRAFVSRIQLTLKHINHKLVFCVHFAHVGGSGMFHDAR